MGVRPTRACSIPPTPLKERSTQLNLVNIGPEYSRPPTISAVAIGLRSCAASSASIRSRAPSKWSRGKGVRILAAKAGSERIAASAGHSATPALVAPSSGQTTKHHSTSEQVATP